MTGLVRQVVAVARALPKLPAALAQLADLERRHRDLHAVTHELYIGPVEAAPIPDEGGAG